MTLKKLLIPLALTASYAATVHFLTSYKDDNQITITNPQTGESKTHKQNGNITSIDDTVIEQAKQEVEDLLGVKIKDSEYEIIEEDLPYNIAAKHLRYSSGKNIIIIDPEHNDTKPLQLRNLSHEFAHLIYNREFDTNIDDMRLRQTISEAFAYWVSQELESTDNEDLNQIDYLQLETYEHIDRDLATKLATKFLETSKKHGAPYVATNFHELISQVFEKNFVNYKGTRYKKKTPIILKMRYINQNKRTKTLKT
jgi:hypothetical protein